MNTLNKDNPGTTDRVKFELGSHYKDETACHPIQRGSALMSKFEKLVDNNFTKHSLPKQYAAQLFVTPSYLNTMSHKILGKTAGEIIRERKLKEAKRMLVNFDLTISQVAYDLNFTDPPHFSKFFKKYTGKSPEDYRKSALFAMIGVPAKP